MPNNNVTGGLGSRLIIGGYAGNGIVDGSPTLVQNPGFEIPGANPGAASNWTTDIVYTESEYATFTRPGLDVVTNQIPADLPTLGFIIVPNIDGTISITQAANTDTAQEDYEEGWSNNEQFLFALPDVAAAEATFENRPGETFDGGWLNDPGLESNADSVSTVLAIFSHHLDPHSGVPTQSLLENFEAFWPATSLGTLLFTIPNVVFGTTIPTSVVPSIAGSYTPQNQIINVDTHGNPQYADVLLIRITQHTTVQFSIVITYIDKNELHQTASVFIDQDLPVGTVLTSFGTSLTGIRTIDSFTPDGTHGYPGVSLEGDPGVAFVPETTIEIDSWVRAQFT